MLLSSAYPKSGMFQFLSAASEWVHEKAGGSMASARLRCSVLGGALCVWGGKRWYMAFVTFVEEILLLRVNTDDSNSSLS